MLASKNSLLISALVLAGINFSASAFAAGPPPLPGAGYEQGMRQAAQDVPSRVGRLAFVNGGVDMYNERMGDWAGAPLNTPITSRTALWADGNSRAEVRVGSTVLRLDSNTQANFQQLDDQHTTVEVVRGSLSLRLRNWQSNERVVLLAGGAQLQIDNVGFYRVDFAPQNNTLSVRVMAGAATLSFGAQRFSVQSGQQLAVDLGSQQITAQFDAQRGEFERWAEQRDRGWDSMPSARYVSSEMTGIESLDSHGAWTTDASYGAVWTPRVVSAGWAPYRYGHWSYVNPWGWTWVDDAPWGYAPFHYGRWVFLGGTWGWAPGQRIARPVWAPALVGFYGSSGNISFSITSGAAPVVGWFPLGPGEVWRPGYRHSDTYIRNVNITNITNVTNVYNNSGTPSANGAFPDTRNPVAIAGGERFRYAQTAFAATVVPQAAFASGKPIAAAYTQVQPAQLAAVPIAGTAVKPLYVPSVGNANSGAGSYTSGGLSAPSAPSAPMNAGNGNNKPLFAPGLQPGVQPSAQAQTPSVQQAQQIMNGSGRPQAAFGKPLPSQPATQGAAPQQGMQQPGAQPLSVQPLSVPSQGMGKPTQQIQVQPQGQFSAPGQPMAAPAPQALQAPMGDKERQSIARQNAANAGRMQVPQPAAVGNGAQGGSIQPGQPQFQGKQREPVQQAPSAPTQGLRVPHPEQAQQQQVEQQQRQQQKIQQQHNAKVERERAERERGDNGENNNRRERVQGRDK